MGTRQSGEAFQNLLPGGDMRLLDEAVRCVREMETDPSLASERQAVERAAEAFFREREIRIAMN